MEPRSAFARANAFLNYTAVWKWTARLAAVGAGVCTLGLFLILALFADLVIHRGRVPDFYELNEGIRNGYKGQYVNTDRVARSELLKKLEMPESAYNEFDAEWLPRSITGHEWMWRAWFHDQMLRRSSPAAAEVYRAACVDDHPHDSPALGVLSLAARQPRWPVQGLLFRAAAWNRWMWQTGTGNANNMYLIGLALLGVVIAIVRAGMRNLTNFAAATSTLDAATRMRRMVYHHSYRLGTLALNETSDSEALTIFANDIEQIRAAQFARMTTYFSEPLQLVLLLAFALALHFWLAVACILLAAVTTLLGGYIAARNRDIAKHAGRRADGQLGLLRESLGMMRLVKANHMETFNQTRVERQLGDYSDASFAKFRGESLFAPLLVFLGTVTIAVAAGLAGAAAIHGTVGPGRLALLAATLATAYWPLSRILADRRVVRLGRHSAVPVFEFLDRPGEAGQVVGAEFLPGINRGIEFRSVTLREPNSGKMILRDVDLKIGAARRVAIVGTDEAEKHALVYLLLRFVDTSAGEVRIDDKNLKWLTLESVRNQIGAVLDNSLTFNDTVANNISCGDPGVSLPQVIEAAKLAHAHQFIQRLPYGYETPIGEFGSSLRHSERFRIALARAILKDPSLYIIEEPLTAFDEERKGLIDDTLGRVLAGKTVVFLAHRISTIRSCDVVYLMHNGRVEAQGEHRELLAKSDLYKHLHYMEFNEFADKV